MATTGCFEVVWRLLTIHTRGGIRTVRRLARPEESRDGWEDGGSHRCAPLRTLPAMASEAVMVWQTLVRGLVGAELCYTEPFKATANG